MAEAPLGIISQGSDGRFTLTFERDLPHPQSEVWRAVTSEEGLACWLSAAEVELRPQGSIRLHGQCHVVGQIVEVTPPFRFRWTWPHPDHPLSEVQIAVTATGEAASFVTLVQTHLPKRHVLDVAAGWHTHLDALPGAVRGDRTAFNPARAAAHYLKYADLLAA